MGSTRQGEGSGRGRMEGKERPTRPGWTRVRTPSGPAYEEGEQEMPAERPRSLEGHTLPPLG